MAWRASLRLFGVKLLPWVLMYGPFESTGIYSFNRQKVPEYLFSILDTGELLYRWKWHFQVRLWFV